MHDNQHIVGKEGTRAAFSDPALISFGGSPGSDGTPAARGRGVLRMQDV